MSILAATVTAAAQAVTAATPSSDASAAWQFAVLMADCLLAAVAAALPTSRVAVLRTPEASFSCCCWALTKSGLGIGFCKWAICKCHPVSPCGNIRGKWRGSYAALLSAMRCSRSLLCWMTIYRGAAMGSPGSNAATSQAAVGRLYCLRPTSPLSALMISSSSSPLAVASPADLNCRWL